MNSTSTAHWSKRYFTYTIKTLDVFSLGPPGPVGAKGATPPTSYLFVRHSQSLDVPECQTGQTKLWEGYSLLYIEANEKSHHQDLGKCL